MSDGLCHHCERRRENIKFLHKVFPETNPEKDDKYPSFHLDLWKKSPPKYIDFDTYLKRFDRLYDYPLRENAELRSKSENIISEMEGLERHFRLAQSYLLRNRTYQ